MSEFFKQSGVLGFPLLVISIVNVILVIRCAAGLAKGAGANTAKLPHSINAILFWGGVSAAIGFLGQCNGLYNALGVISRAQVISPNLVAQGFAESFTTTIFGLTILVLSALAWFALSAWSRRVSGPARPS